MADALKEGYNVITVSFADTFTVDGSFQLHPTPNPNPNPNPHPSPHPNPNPNPNPNPSRTGAGRPSTSWCRLEPPHLIAGGAVRG